MSRSAYKVFTAAAFLLTFGNVASAGFVLTVEAPDVQSTSVSGVVTETFDGLRGGDFSGSLVTAVGTITTPGRIATADPYGGAGGAGKYASFGYASGSEAAVMALNGPQSYLGFWWSAADPGNSIRLFSGGTLVGQVDTPGLFGPLDHNYLGNPTAHFLGHDFGEKFAYVNIFATGTTTFDTVAFLNSDRGTGFEVDNVSIRKSAVASPYPGTIVPNGVQAVPEPGSLALFGAGGLTLLAWSRRRKASG